MAAEMLCDRRKKQKEKKRNSLRDRERIKQVIAGRKDAM